MEYSITFLTRGVWGSLPIVTISDPGPVWTIFSTSNRIFRKSMSRFLSTLAATPDPSLTRPSRMCSVPMYSWLNRWASWLASCITLRARSVKRSYIEAFSDKPSLGAAHGAYGGEVEWCPGNPLPDRIGRTRTERTPVHHTDGAAAVPTIDRGRGAARASRHRKLDATGDGAIHAPARTLGEKPEHHSRTTGCESRRRSLDWRTYEQGRGSDAESATRKGSLPS